MLIELVYRVTELTRWHQAVEYFRLGPGKQVWLSCESTAHTGEDTDRADGCKPCAAGPALRIVLI